MAAGSCGSRTWVWGAVAEWCSLLLFRSAAASLPSAWASTAKKVIMGAAVSALMGGIGETGGLLLENSFPKSSAIWLWCCQWQFLVALLVGHGIVWWCLLWKIANDVFWGAIWSIDFLIWLHSMKTTFFTSCLTARGKYLSEIDNCQYSPIFVSNLNCQHDYHVLCSP